MTLRHEGVRLVLYLKTYGRSHSEYGCRYSDEQKESQPISLPPLLRLLSFKPALASCASHPTCTAGT